MKADKQPDKNNGEVRLTGRVISKKFGPGSKSEHDSVCLQTRDCIYQLRRLGANPFSDPKLNKLIGKQVTATGQLINTLFIATEITAS